MLRSILVALDDTPGAQAARDLGIGLARRLGAALTLAVVLDRPHSRDAEEPVPVGGAAFAERRNAVLAARLEAEAQAALDAARQAAAGLPFAELRLEEAPEPALLRAGATHDLILLGRDSTLGREENEDGLAPVVEALLKDGPRPLLVVPPGAPAEGQVLVGYDGSLPAQRALQSFALLGLAEGAPVTLLAAHAEREEAGRLAAEGAAYLRRHGLAVTEWPVVGGHPAELLLAEAARLPARLLVMGGFGKTGLRALLLGTSTRRLLREAPCAVFVQH
ncbi:universal stress protein [Siccirubricoccus sp. KC 17139]|uniref:Universal stress protein n=1 Tax=Siccirubricoccus soli TaxID=2899147 RepID=A0ABT1D9F2_9PROT|nr:universal stress protein [Siccirubricoccus soli]MCO6417630.1 universal stress protein [Siccirubricoccus soli]MCP2683765.1 universal stress protein [Siccirubricoccus soli]